MANAACKLLRCSQKVAAAVNNATVTSGFTTTDIQARLNSKLTSAQQNEMIENLNKILDVYEEIGDEI